MTVVLILAAGAASRMGAPKQLLPYDDRNLVGHVLENALRADCGPVLLVLGAAAAEVSASLADGPVTIVINSDWGSGLGSSVRCGVVQVRSSFPDATSVLILLADQPRVDPALIRQFAALHPSYPGKILAAAYDGTSGVPALFPTRFFDALLSLPSQRGAKLLLERYAADVIPVSIKENPDIDTPEDYLRELEKLRD